MAPSLPTVPVDPAATAGSFLGAWLGRSDDVWSAPARLLLCLAGAVGSWALLVGVLELALGR